MACATWRGWKWTALLVINRGFRLASTRIKRLANANRYRSNAKLLEYRTFPVSLSIIALAVAAKDLSRCSITLPMESVFSVLAKKGELAMTRKRKHGGRRAGAGRPTLGAAKLKRVNVILGDEHIERAREIGKGNLSVGTRTAIEKHRLSKHEEKRDEN